MRRSKMLASAISPMFIKTPWAVLHIGNILLTGQKVDSCLELYDWRWRISESEFDCINDSRQYKEVSCDGYFEPKQN